MPGYGKVLGKQLFDVIEKFADYAFNKSHTFGYGLITYQTAYLKAHYPAEYMTAVLSVYRDKVEEVAVYVEDCVFSGQGYVCDANANARFVVRFNTVTGPMKVDGHGKASNSPDSYRRKNRRFPIPKWRPRWTRA